MLGDAVETVNVQIEVVGRGLAVDFEFLPNVDGVEIGAVVGGFFAYGGGGVVVLLFLGR
jgi:hypothetical protein